MEKTQTSLMAEIVDRRPLGASGASGNKLEVVTLRDGRELVLKKVSPEWDHISRATNDRGRILSMWKQGIFDRMPPEVEHATVAVEGGGDGSWSVFMKDVSAAMMRDGETLGSERLERVLAGMAAIHETFWEEDFPELCSLEDRYNLLSPETGRRETERGEMGGRLITDSWELFVGLVPAEIGEPIVRLSEDPRPLADELRKCSQTLIHGDVRFANLGVVEERLVLIDWGERTGAAPPPVDLASFLIFDGPKIGVPYDDVVERFRIHTGERYEERSLRLALIGGLVQLGPFFAITMILAEDEAKRAQAEAASKQALRWWIPTVAEALEIWSPT